MSDLFEEDADSPSGLGEMLNPARLLEDLRTYYLLLITAVIVLVTVVLVLVSFKAPLYTAVAIVGPADNSDDPLAQGIGSAMSGGLGGIAKHLHVGGALGGQGTDDKFDEYSALLTSNRLAGILVNKYAFLQQVFPEDWDPVHKRWLPRDSFFDQTVDFFKRLMNRPVKQAPDQDDLAKYFEQNFGVDPSLDTSFATVTFRFHDRAAAERLLGDILLEADNIIREDKRRDVSARIAFLNTTLEKLSLAEQKPAMIDILSQQEQEMMMVESDHRYASVLIDTPHAPLKPTSPSPIVDSAIAFGLAVFGWLMVVRTLPGSERGRRFLEVFARPRRTKRLRPAHAAA
ncbi:MAG TPA: hypothetical protein VGG24_21920 [Paraburkholderia sp.]|jgi:hypothetical protein